MVELRGSGEDLQDFSAATLTFPKHGELEVHETTKHVFIHLVLSREKCRAPSPRFSHSDISSNDSIMIAMLGTYDIR